MVCDLEVGVQQRLGVKAMAFLLIVMMVGVLLGALILSKGRNFFKYAEMSRSLQSDDKPSRRTQQHQHAAR
jgi:hypothetical protein